MNRLLALALFLPVTAAANTVWTPTGPAVPLCSMDGMHFFPARNGVCYASDANRTEIPPGYASVEVRGALIEPGHISCPGGELSIQTFDIDDPNKSLQIGGVETQWKRVVITCIRKP